MWSPHVWCQKEAGAQRSTAGGATGAVSVSLMLSHQVMGRRKEEGLRVPERPALSSAEGALGP